MTVSAWLLLVACLAPMGGCARTDRSNRGDRIDLSQNVTTDRRPQDKVFAEFEKNWRQFISTSPELALPVASPGREGEAWQPDVVSECVSSADVAGLVPQVTLTWNESGGASAARHEKAPGAGVRFDLALHHNGFARNYFSSALGSDKLQRFKLPSTSGLIKDQEAVLLTGPGLFPQLVDFRVDASQDRDTGRRFTRHTLVLRDLSPGLTYTLRMDLREGNNWKQARHVVFLTPVCPR